MDNPREKRLNLLMLPWLAHGHANRFLELAKRLTHELTNLSIHFCTTAIILESIRDNLRKNLTETSLSGPLPPHTRISLVEFRLPEQTQLPPHLHTTKHLPRHLLPTLIQAFADAEQTVSDLLDTLKPDILIIDVFQPLAAELALQRNLPALVYIACTVAMSLGAHYNFVSTEEFPFPAINLTQDNVIQRTGPAEQCFRLLVQRVFRCLQHSEFVIARSFREIEGKYIDYLSSLIGKEVVPTGPLIPDAGSVLSGNSHEVEKVMRWLDQRERKSVVFVSFGSEYFLPYNEMEQLARGLEHSSACFVWVVRFPKKAGKDDSNDIDDNTSAKMVLQELVERVGPQKGLVVTTWAPQRKILIHQNLGCFITHCGWSSVLEGMQAGISMLALPMNAVTDQPVNAKLIVELGIGIEIPQHGPGNFKGENVSACIKQILHSDYGESVRKNAEDLAEVIRTRKDDEMRILADKIVGLASNVSAA